MGPSRQSLTTIGTGRGPKYQVKDVFGINRQAADLGRLRLQRLGDIARLGAVAVQAETTKFGRGELNGVPFENDGSLGGIATAEDWCRWGSLSEGGVDLVL